MDGALVAYTQEMIALVDERIRAAFHTITAAGTVVERTGSTTCMVVLDGSSLPVPVKAFGDVNVAEGDRVGLVRLGVDWTIIGTFVRRQSITWPLDALSGQHRAVAGSDTPAELQAYGILEALLFYVTDKTTPFPELGYFFIGSSNSLDGGANQKVMLFGNVDYPTPGVPSSATVASVKTNFQMNLFNTTTAGLGYTIFKDSIIQINNTVPSLLVGAADTNFSGNTAWDNGVGWQRRNGGAVSVAGDPGKGILNYTTTGASSASTVAGAPFSAEIVTATIVNHVFESGRAYEIMILGGFNPSSNTTAGNFVVRAGTTTAGALWWDYLWTAPITGTGGGVSPAVAEPGYVRRTGGTPLTSSFVCCLKTNNAGTGTHFANGLGIQRAMIIRDCGAYADVPWATSI